VKRIMKHLLFLTLGALGAACWIGIGLTGCNTTDSEFGVNPYATLSCAAKLERMGNELRAANAPQEPAAKRAALDSPATDTVAHPIQVFRGYPPVTAGYGIDTNGQFIIQVNDTRSNPDSGYAVKPDSGWQVQWIPPVGFPDSSKLPATDLPIRETTTPTTLPTDISVIQIVSTEAYKAHVRICDYRNKTIRTFDQEFGYKGEMNNPSRAVPRGLVSYLVWDTKNDAGRQAPDGTYTWKISLTLASGKVEERSQLTGLIGEACQAELAQ
jgi:hypothetical protein